MGWVLVVLASDASEWGYGVPAMTAKSSEAATNRGASAERSPIQASWRGQCEGLPAFSGSGRCPNDGAQAVGVDEESLREVLPEGEREMGNWMSASRRFRRTGAQNLFGRC